MVAKHIERTLVIQQTHQWKEPSEQEGQPSGTAPIARPRQGKEPVEPAGQPPGTEPMPQPMEYQAVQESKPHHRSF